MSSTPDYSFGSRLLHQLVLSSGFVGETALDLELSRFSGKCDYPHDRSHVFVAGLARAGTTLLMRMLYDTGRFSSLTYRDMPFVLAPNSWEGLVSRDRKKTDVQERAHGDGLMVSSESPEALEEVFWRVTCGKQYITSESLVPMVADDEVIQQFRKYVNVILYRYGGERYLSKNNNNILRISSINRAFPKSVVLVPFREPMQHANSLLKQHRHFSEVQRQDRFVHKYMTWLGHHEFGGGHRPFVFDGKSSDKARSADHIDYWLERWIDCYSWLLKQSQSGGIRVVFSCFEKLCNAPDDYRAMLFEILGLQGEFEKHLEINPAIPGGIGEADHALGDVAKGVYAELTALSLSKPG